MSTSSNTMRAIAVTDSWSSGPKFTTELPKPSIPSSPDHVQIQVLASGLHQLVRTQTAGKHYTNQKSTLPYIPGSDGVGLDSTGSLVYFNSINTGGGFAEYINVPSKAIFKIPYPSTSSIDEKRKTAIYMAALMNPGMSSWMALTTRTTNLRKDFTVLILGATSISGRIAARHARTLGAKTVIGVARPGPALTSLISSSHLDHTIPLLNPVSSTDFASALTSLPHIDVILDYVYGPAALHLLSSLPSNPLTAHDTETQYVQIGSLGGGEVDIPSALLRSRNLTIRGSGPGSWSVTKNVAEQYPRLLEVMVKGVGDFEITQRKLEDVEEGYADKKARTVFVM